MRYVALASLALLALWAGVAGAQETVQTTAQQTVRERARETLPANVYQEVEALATELDRDGIPAEPLFNKALEGMAKRVPTDRIVPAVSHYATQLRQAREAFPGVGNGPLYIAGADALQRGVGQDLLRRLGQGQEGDPPPTPVAVLVLADLVEAGVPADRALGVLREAMRVRAREQEILGISGQVRQLMRQGQSAQDAAEQVRRALQRGRGGGGIGTPPVPPGSEPSIRSRRQSGSWSRGGGGSRGGSGRNTV
jgi:hypothetical protein